jgi:hypothetical protein
LLGISRDIYTNTACISRSEVLRLEDAGSIKEAIVALADSAHPDRTAQAVLDRLRQERAQRIGKPRGRTGPLHDLESRLADLERQINAARQARGAVDELAQKRETVSALTEAELAVVQLLDAAVLASRLDEARHRLERVETLEKAIGDERTRQEDHTRFAMFPLDRQSEVQELRSHLRATRETQEDFERRSAENAAQVQQLEAERAKLDLEAQGHQTRARGIDAAALEQERPKPRLARAPDGVPTGLFGMARAPQCRRRGAEPRWGGASPAAGAAQARYRALQRSAGRHQGRPASRGSHAA